MSATILYDTPTNYVRDTGNLVSPQIVEEFIRVVGRTLCHALYFPRIDLKNVWWNKWWDAMRRVWAKYSDVIPLDECLLLATDTLMELRREGGYEMRLFKVRLDDRHKNHLRDSQHTYSDKRLYRALTVEFDSLQYEEFMNTVEAAGGDLMDILIDLLANVPKKEIAERHGLTRWELDKQIERMRQMAKARLNVGE